MQYPKKTSSKKSNRLAIAACLKDAKHIIKNTAMPKHAIDFFFFKNLIQRSNTVSAIKSVGKNQSSFDAVIMPSIKCPVLIDDTEPKIATHTVYGSKSETPFLITPPPEIFRCLYFH